MKKLLALIAFSVLLLAPVGAQNAFAVSIPITNFSFEDPSGGSTTVTGWTETETSASDAVITDTFFFSTDGTQVAQVTNGAKISQSLGIIAPNTKYTVMVDAGFGPGTANIFADGTLIDSEGVINDPELSSKTLVLNNINAHTGKELTIVLVGNNGALFDRVRATSENLDSDGDGVLDGDDVCPGFDDNMDTDGDGTADGCDENPTLKCGENTKQEGFECVADLDSICGAGTKIENMMCVISIAVGGAFIGVDKSALFLAAGQLTAAWVLPVIVSGIGFAIVIARKF